MNVYATYTKLHTKYTYTMMLLMGMWMSFTKKPMNPMIANPMAVAIAIFWNSVEEVKSVIIKQQIKAFPEINYIHTSKVLITVNRNKWVKGICKVPIKYLLPVVYGHVQGESKKVSSFKHGCIFK